MMVVRTARRAGRMLQRWQRNTPRWIAAFVRYQRERRRFRREVAAHGGEFAWGPGHMCLHDDGVPSGGASGHYFHQDLLVARRVFCRCPEHHVDVGSRIDGLVAHIASFRSVEALDIRPQPSSVPNVTFRQADLMHLADDLVGYADSVSCLHALEHFGLGRYGDALDYEGHRKGLQGLHQLLRPEGMLYLSVPIGPARIEFNAHRVFSVKSLFALVDPLFERVAFSYVDDDGGLHEDVALDSSLTETNCGCYYGCGILELRRR